eukprot:GEZU01015086.1.p2 GENE.GEZU01015086.1~~GEZU01015086.1.p2  ORF type:complete len:105 (-),score=35.50 GEZU01015086.1:620-904(-)
MEGRFMVSGGNADPLIFYEFDTGFRRAKRDITAAATEAGEQDQHPTTRNHEEDEDYGNYLVGLYREEEKEVERLQGELTARYLNNYYHHHPYQH